MVSTYSDLVDPPGQGGITDTQAQTISALSTQLALCEARIAALEQA